MKKIFLILIAVTFFVFLDSSVFADESRIFVGKIEKDGPAFRYFWKFTAVADNGEKKEFCVPRGGTTIIQIDGKQRYGEAPRKGNKIEVKYLVTEDGDNKTVSMRYVPLDYVQQPPATLAQTVAPEKPTDNAMQIASQPKNTVIGKVKDITGVAFGLINDWTYAKIIVLSDNGNETIFFVKPTTALINEKGVTNPPLPKNGQRVEVKYSLGKKGSYEATSIRYLPPDYVPQTIASNSAGGVSFGTTQPIQETTGQAGDIFVGKVESVQKMLPRPPYWRLAILTIITDTGEKASVDVVGETIVSDASGRKISTKAGSWNLKSGERVEVKYSPKANNGHDKAVSIQRLD